MRAILIDPENKEVREVEIVGDLGSWYRAIDCTCVCMSYDFENGDSLVMDDEGALAPNHYWSMPGLQPLAGKALVVGVSDYGDSAPCKSSLDWIRSKVIFPEGNNFLKPIF